ncbi:MAG: hypothetical protein ABEI52_10470 [Halobacteriaceae archaeon]
MSAFKYLMFLLGVILVAVLGSILNAFVQPLLPLLEAHATSQAAQTGVSWYKQFWNWVPFITLGLLLFMLIIGIVNRRRGVVR